GRRHDQEGEDQQRSGDLADLGRGGTQQRQEEGRDHPDGYAPGPGHVRIDGREEEWTGDDGQGHQYDPADDQQGQDLNVGDPEEQSEEQRRGAVQEAAVQADEQRTTSQCERLHRPDQGGLAVVSGPALTGQGDDHRGGQRRAEVPVDGADADEHGTGGAR